MTARISATAAHHVRLRTDKFSTINFRTEQNELLSVEVEEKLVHQGVGVTLGQMEQKHRLGKIGLLTPNDRDFCLLELMKVNFFNENDKIQDVKLNLLLSWSHRLVYK